MSPKTISVFFRSGSIRQKFYQLKAEMERSSYHVPGELVEEIFSWLPPKSLFRFKCVCKSWKSRIVSLIDDPAFVTKHLRNAKDNIFAPTTLMFLPDPYVEFKSSLLNIQSDDADKDEIASSSTEDFSVLLSYGTKDFGVDAYHCDGVVCLNYHNREIVLCNPALREFKLVPPPINFLDPDKESFLLATGFGYDSIANDYKIVLMYYDDVAEIYSLSTGSWRAIKKDVYTDMDRFCNVMVLHHRGICYWLFDERKDVMLSFDFHSEVFRLIELPAPIERSGILVWNDSIAFFCRPECGAAGMLGVSIIEMWVMDNSSSSVVGGSCAWTKLLSIGPFAGRGEPLTFWNSDELLIEHGRTRGFLSYNLRTKKYRNICVKSIEHEIYMGHYLTTLVSINRRE